MSRSWKRSGSGSFTGVSGRRHSRPQKPAQHGTQSGYVIHRLYGETACDECKAAHNAYTTIQHQRRKARAAGEPLPELPGSRERAEVLRHKAETGATSDGRVTRSAS